MASKNLSFQFKQECDVSVEKTSFVWTIKKFSCATKLKKQITSDKFFNNVTKTKWNLEISTVGPDNILRLTLRGSKSHHHEKLSFALKDSSDNLIRRKQIASSDVLYPVSVTFSQIKDLSFLIPDDVLQICVEITEFVHCRSTMNQKPEDNCLLSLKDFVSKLGDMWKTEKFADITIFVNQTRIKAHKLVLASSSPVFSAMLQHPTLEYYTDIIVIQDFDSDVIKKMLQYMYTRQPPNFRYLGIDFSLQLLEVADKYAVEDLKTLIVEHLTSIMTLQNVAKIYPVAEMHCINVLKEKCLDQVCDCFQGIFQLHELKDLKNCPSFLKNISSRFPG